MFHKWFHIVFILAATLAFSLNGHAQTAKAEQQKLAGMQSQLQQKQADLQQAKQELEAAQKARGSLEGSSGPEKTKLDKAASALAEARQTAEADPSDSNQARLKNAEFKHALAERKYKKANAELFELDDKIADLSKQVETTNTDISALNQSIAAQTEAVKQAQAKALAARKAEEQRLKEEAAKAELARAKAEQERKQREEAARKAAELAAARKAAEEKAAAAQAAAAAKTATPTPAAPAMAVSKPAAPMVSAPAPAPAPAAAPSAGATDTGVTLLTTKAEVEAEQKRLADLLATPDRDKNRYNKILNVKPVGADGKPGKSESHSLQALGHGQYQGTARIKGGKAIFVVGFNQWPQSVPGSASADYVVVLDASDAKKPRIIYYPESLAK